MTRSRATADTQDNNGGSVAPFVAGKNRIINGDFFWNQRNFTSNTASGTYNFDRWVTLNSTTANILTITPQTFTVGTAPVTGYEGRRFVQCVTGTTVGADYAILEQRIEGVRTFANQTVTLSFWAKTTAGTPKIGLEISQIFGTGGSPSAEVNTAGGAITTSTDWTRYSTTVTLPSISGKTIGTANDDYLAVRFWFTAAAASNWQARSGIQVQNNATFQIWGVQLEAGSVATPFTTATGTLAGELAACQRYYFRTTTATDAFGMLTNIGPASSTTLAKTLLVFPVEMRVVPSSVEYSTILVDDLYSGGAAATAIVLANRTTKITMVEATVASGLTLGRQYALRGNNSTSAYLGLSAEL